MCFVVWDLGVWVQGSGRRLRGLRFELKGLGFGVLGEGFEVRV